MIFKIDYQDKEKVARLLNKNGIEFKSHASEFDAFVAHEINECERVYGGSFGKYTNDLIAKEVEDIVSNKEIGFVSEIYHDKVMEYSKIMDQKTIAVAYVSNNMSVLLKKITCAVEDKATVVFEKDIYECELKNDKHESDGGYIEVGAFELTMQDFIRVNN